MPFDPGLLVAMPDTITVELPTGRDAAGNATYAAPVANVRANVVRRKTRGSKPAAPDNKEGKRPSNDGQVIVAPMGLVPDARLTLPSGTAYVSTVETYGDPYAPGTDYIQVADYVMEQR